MSLHGLSGDALIRPPLGNLTSNQNHNCNAPRPCLFSLEPQPASASFTCFAGLKPNLREATISIASPVAGFRPWRDGLSFTLNLPNPGKFAYSPFLAASTMPVNTASMAFFAVLLSTSFARNAINQVTYLHPCFPSVTPGGRKHVIDRMSLRAQVAVDRTGRGHHSVTPPSSFLSPRPTITRASSGSGR